MKMSGKICVTASIVLHESSTTMKIFIFFALFVRNKCGGPDLGLNLQQMFTMAHQNCRASCKKKNSLWQCLTHTTFLSNYVFIPFQADFLLASRENKWPRRVELSAGEYIMMHNANVMVHFVPNNENENWSGEDSVARPRVVRRGIVDIEDEIDDGG